MYRILLIDDNPLVIEGIRQNIDFGKVGARVEGALYDAPSALALLEAQPDIDVVISDIRMPGMDGLAMSRHMLELRGDLKIILISAYDDFEYAKQALRMGAFDYVEKPLDYPYLQQVIEQAVGELGRERRRLEQLRRSVPALTDHFFRLLLHTGREESLHRLQSYIQYLNINLDWRYFNCSIVRMENIDEVKTGAGIEKYHTGLMALQDDIRALLGDLPLVYLLSDLDAVYIITAMTCREERMMSRILNDAFAQLAEGRRSGYGFFSLNIGIGGIVSGVWDLSVSCRNARTALEYHFFFPQKHIFDYRDVGGAQGGAIGTDHQAVDAIVEAICRGDRAQVAEAVGRFMEGFQGKYRSRGAVFFSLYTVLGRIQQALEEMGILSEAIQKRISSFLVSPNSLSSPDKAAAALGEICLQACELIRRSTSNHYEKLCLLVGEYIERNYRQAGLGLPDIAAHVNVSPAHLSAVYKKTTDKNISDVITQVRIKVAKRLLETTGLSIRDISEQTGYSNQYYFSASFKKNAGVTPSDYRAGRRG